MGTRRGMRKAIKIIFVYSRFFFVVFETVVFHYLLYSLELGKIVERNTENSTRRFNIAEFQLVYKHQVEEIETLSNAKDL